MFEVINESKFAQDIVEGDLVVQYDKVFRVLGIWCASLSGALFTVDLLGNGDEYEHWEYNQQINTVRIMADIGAFR
jgi:hypothetical protein